MTPGDDAELMPQRNSILKLMQKRSYFGSGVAAFLMWVVVIYLYGIFSDKAKERIPSYYWIAKWATMANVMLCLGLGMFLREPEPIEGFVKFLGCEKNSEKFKIWPRIFKSKDKGRSKRKKCASVTLMITSLLGMATTLVAAILGVVFFGLFVPLVFKLVEQSCPAVSGIPSNQFSKWTESGCLDYPETYACAIDFDEAWDMCGEFFKTFSYKAPDFIHAKCIEVDDFNFQQDFADLGKKRAMIIAIGCGLSFILYNAGIVYAFEQMAQYTCGSRYVKSSNTEQSYSRYWCECFECCGSAEAREVTALVGDPSATRNVME